MRLCGFTAAAATTSFAVVEQKQPFSRLGLGMFQLNFIYKIRWQIGLPEGPETVLTLAFTS